MRTIQTRFGAVAYDPKKVVHFPEGLIGFERLRDFIVMPYKHEDFLFCLQSVEETHVAFLFINPVLFFKDYRVVVERKVREKLRIDVNDPYFILTTITFHQDQSVTLNLLAPVVYAPKTDRAVQIVLEGSGYLTKTLLKSGVSSP
ncbi:MAG: flagellar assembly protein FliW [Desulfobacterales bacterium]|nr:flagellar assembly protein FliW [Desulfobacterales bacterium]